MKKEKISVIIPCFNEEKVINDFYKEIKKVIEIMNYVDFEILFINDGSKDKTLNNIRDISKKDNLVRYLSFSRNFGKEAAMYAGFNNVTGDYVAVMDVDLQDDPKLILNMYKDIKENNYDVVATYCDKHHDYSKMRNFFTKLWYYLNSKLLDNNEKPGTRDFRLMKRKVVESLISMKEINRYTRGLYSYVGYNVKWIEVELGKRVGGESKFPISKLITYSLEAITSTSTKPLVLAAYLGILLCLFSFILIIIIITKTLIWGDPATGWPSLVCLITFLSGMQLFFFGVMGIYLSKIYTEVKGRPIYFIDETEKDVK